jgi:hypothetical protein
MYEKPSLVPVGPAEKTIRGLVASGYDIDSLRDIPNSEFEGDIELSSEVE